ncbi:hypothetical protein B0H19DRAFT_1130027 [Mycena capillaripes]|nr:hypothetical protein B0H19DRAFT_1130027 [Mycena capillaripes]
MLVLIFDHVPEFATRYDYWVVPYYTPVFRTIIICRFLLMLRAVYYDEGAETKSTATGTLHFASRVIGPLGAPVDVSTFDEDYTDFEDEESIVYAEDPLVAGLAMMSEARAVRGKGKAVMLRDMSHNGSGSRVEGERV